MRMHSHTRLTYVHAHIHAPFHPRTSHTSRIHAPHASTHPRTSRFQDYGVWSGVPPACAPITCPKPTAVKNADMSVNGQSIGSQAQYMCQV
jgi:hypothetical protein